MGIYQIRGRKRQTGNIIKGDAIVQTEYDWSTTTPSHAVIQAISAIENVEPISLSDKVDATLYDSVDLDALDRLATTDTDVRISFRFETYLVEIDGNTVSVSEWTEDVDLEV